MHGAVKSYRRCLYVVCCHHSFCYLGWLIYVGKSGLQKTKKRTWQEKRKAAFPHRRRFGRIRQAYEGQGRDSGRFRRRGIERKRTRIFDNIKYLDLLKKWIILNLNGPSNNSRSSLEWFNERYPAIKDQ